MFHILLQLADFENTDAECLQNFKYQNKSIQWYI